jgi:hypothetical protein
MLLNRSRLQLLEASLSTWLADNGLFVASMDVHDLEAGDGDRTRHITTESRRTGLRYDTRRRLISCRGPRHVNLAFRYVGADDTADPNYTGQHAVDSNYELAKEARR